MNTHFLKTINPYFIEVWDGEKTFEVRNNDREFEVGDDVYLREYDFDLNCYRQRAIKVRITYILKDFSPIEDGFVVFSFRIIHRFDNFEA